MARGKVFAATEDGRLFVKINAVMSPIVAVVDGLPMTFFGGGKKKAAYMEVDAAIEWCEKEREHHSREKYDKMIGNLRLAKARHKQEEADERKSKRLSPRAAGPQGA